MDPYELALRRELGLDGPVEEEGWDPFQPIRTAFGATQGSVTGAVRGLMPEAYAAAQAENRTNFGVDENSPWYEKTEALPGAGDVGAQFVPESVRESLPGRMAGPALRLVGNILGDPTTYTPAIVGKIGGLLAKGTRGADVLSAATKVAREIPLKAAEDIARGVPIAAEEVARAVDTARKVGIGETARAIAETSPLRSKAYLAAEVIKEAEPWALGTAAAVAYGPQVIESGLGSLKDTLVAAGQGDLEQAAVSGANTILMAGLGGLMGKGLIDTARARRTITQAMADQGILPNEAGPFTGPTLPLPKAGTAADALGAWKEPGTVEGPGFEFYPPSVAPQNRIEGLQAQVAGAPPLKQPRPPVWVGRGRVLDRADTREMGPVPVQDLGALQAETARGMGPAELPMRPGPELPTVPEGFRGRVRTDEELAAILTAEGERARRAAREQVVREPLEEGVAGLPELSPAVEERLAAFDIAPEQFPPLPGQTVLRGMAEPRPIIREPAPRALRAKGKAKQLRLDLGEGVEIRKPLTAQERADAKTAALDEKVRQALADPDAQGLINAQVQRELTNILDEMTRVKSRQREATAAKKAVKAGDTTNPIFAEAQARALGKVTGDFRRMAKGGLDPAEQLRTAREKQLADAEAARIDAENTLAGVEEPVLGEVVDPPAPTMAPAGAVRELVAPEPVRPTTEVPVSAEPVLGAPVEPAPAVEPVRPPSTPVDRMGWTPEQWAESVIRNEKNPEVKAALEANQGALVERIRKLHEGDRAAKAEVQIPYTEEHARKGAYLAKGELAAELLPGKVRGKKTPAPIPAKVEAPVVEAPVEGGPAPAPGVTRLPPGVAEGAEGSGATAQPRQRLGKKAREGPLPGAEGPEEGTAAVVGKNPLKSAFKTEVEAEAREKGAGLSEHANRWLTVLYPHLREQGRDVKATLDSFVERGVKIGNPLVKLTEAKAAEFRQYMDAYDKQLAQMGEKLEPAKARDLALKDLAPDEAIRKGLRNRIGAIEKLLSTEVMEATKQAVGEQTGRAVPETAPVVTGKDRSPAKLKQLAEAKVALERQFADWIGKAPEARSLDEVAVLLGRLRDVAEEIPSSLGSGDVAKKLGAREIANIGMHLFPEEFASAIKNKQGLLDGPRSKGLITKLAEALGVKLPERARAETTPVVTKKAERAITPKDWTLIQRREGNIVWHQGPHGTPGRLSRAGDGRLIVDFDGVKKDLSGDAVVKDLNALLADPNVAEIRNADLLPKMRKHVEPWLQEQIDRKLLAVDVDHTNPDAPTKWVKVMGSTKGMEAVDELSRADRNRVNSLPREQLSVRAEREMARVFDLAESEGLDLGDGMRAVNHHDHFGWGYVGRVASISKGAAAGMKQIFDKLVGVLSPKTKLEFGGLTMSPHLSGLFREAAGGQSAKVYGNLAEAVYRSHSYEDAVSRVTHMLGHEVAHLSEDVGDAGARIEHGYHFDDLAGYVDRLVKTEEWQRDAQETLRKSGFTEEVYGKLKGDLADQFREARDEVRGQDWRQGAAAVEGVPAGAAEGRAAAQPSLLGRGAEAAAGDRAHGLQRGGDVHGGGRGPTGGVRPGAAALEGRPEGVRRGEAQGAGPVAGRGRGEAEAFFAGLESRDQPESVEGARRALNELVKSEAVSVTRAEELAMEWASNLSEKLSDAEIAAKVKSAPDPRGRLGVEASGMNLLVDIPNMSDRSKVRMRLYQDFMDDAGLTSRSKVQHWEDLDQATRDLFETKTPEEFAKLMQRRRGKGVTSHEVRQLHTVRDEFARRTSRIKDLLAKQLEEGVDEATITDTLKELKTARNNEAAAISLATEAATGVARALGVHRAAGIELDAQGMFRAKARASIYDWLRHKIKDTGELNRKTEELLGKFYEELDNGSRTFAEFRKARDIAMGRIGAKAGFYKALEWFKAGLLGWPSEVANVSGNGLIYGARYGENTIAALLDAGYAKLSGKPREVFLGEAKVKLRALRRSMLEGLPELMRAEGNVLRLNGRDMRKVMDAGAAIDDLMMVGGAIDGKFGNLVRMHLDSMGNWDDLAKLTSKTDTLYTEIYRRLQKGGEKWLTNRMKTGEKMEDAVERIVGDMRENLRRWEKGESYDEVLFHRSKPMFEKADKTALRDTYQAELGDTGRGVQSFLRLHPWLQFLFPFYRTPTNILKETITRTPVGFYQAWKHRAELSRAEMVGELAKPIMGTAIMGTIATLAAHGEITGGGPLTFEDREALQATGWQPYSIQVGDQWISYARLEPIASLMGMAADAVEGLRAGDFQAFDTGFHKSMTSISANLTNKTFLSGLTSLTGAIGDPKREMGSFLKQLQQSVVPNSIGFIPFGHAARALDPVYRQTDPAAWSVFQAKIPFASMMLPPTYGPTGEVRTRPGTPLEMLISPFARRAVETGPKAVGSEELVKLGAVPKAPMRYWTSPQGFRVDLRPEERQLLAKALQGATELIGQRIVKDPSYQRLPKDEMDPNYRYGQKTQKDVLEGVVNRARSRALRQIMPSLKQRSRQAYEQREL